MKTVETGPRVENFPVSEDSLAAIIQEARAYEEIVPETDVEDGADELDERDAPPHDEGLGHPERQVLMEAIRALSMGRQEALVAVCWIGRGDYEAEEWDEALKFAAERDNGNVAGYLAGIPMLADYLEAGAAALGINLSDTSSQSMSH
ncbi:MAG: hypothetical protein CMK09_05665 [Ponticaulis sp.]|nr:hypothetical protein [Ponticaulis sp.]|tara:strand:+ start:38247 stop:38690 length:444 start_codon:yes stop_codon:yes gene_type:complete